MFVYALNPIDEWPGWCKPDDVFRIFAEPFEACWAVQDWLHYWNTAQKAARDLGWEGDCIVGPLVAPLPRPASNDCLFMIGWKQRDNGTCYIASPYQLDWLAADALGVARTE